MTGGFGWRSIANSGAFLPELLKAVGTQEEGAQGEHGLEGFALPPGSADGGPLFDDVFAGGFDQGRSPG